MIDRSKKLQAFFYQSASGAEPVRDWLLDLTDDDRRVVGKDIAKVEFGWPVGMPYCRAMGGGLWEVRSHISSGRITRVFFCLADGHMILLHAFTKKTQETPKSEMDVARTRMKEIS